MYELDPVIEDYLLEKLTPELADLARVALRLCSAMSFHQLPTDITNLISLVENRGVMQTNDLILINLELAVTEAILDFGVKLEDDTSFMFKVELLEALIQLDQLADVEYGLSCLEVDTTTEALATLLEYTTSKPIEEYLMALESVDYTLIQNIRNNYQDYLTSNLRPRETEPLIDTKIKLFKLYRTFTNDEYGPLKDLIQASLPIGLPYRDYLDRLSFNDNDLIDLNAKVAPISIDYIKTLACLAIISDSDKDPITVTQDNLESLHENPSIALKLANATKQLLLDFQNYLRTNKGV